MLLVALFFFSACNKKQGKDFDTHELKESTLQSEQPTIKESEQLAAQIESQLILFAQQIISGALPDSFSDNEKWSLFSNRFINSSEQSRNIKASVFEMWHEKNTIQTVARIEMKARLNNQNYFGLITQFKSSWSKNEDGQ